MIRVLRSLAGLLGTAAIVAGIPAVLWTAGGNPIPALVSLDGLAEALVRPDDGSAFIQVIIWIGWIAWIYFTIAVLLELISQVSGLRLKVPGFRAPRAAAGPLVAALLALFIAAPSASAFPPVTAPSTAVSVSDRVTTQQGIDQDEGQELAEARSTGDRAATPERGNQSVHVVTEDGTSLWTLAEQYYGDGTRWKEIAFANRDLVGPDGSRYLEPGWALIIPNPTVAADADGARAAGGGGGARPADDRPARATAERVYTVKRNDNLSKIAETFYGDPDEWPRIYKANRDQIDDPDEIDIGWKLVIPGPVSGTGSEDQDGRHTESAQPPETRRERRAPQSETSEVERERAEAEQAAKEAQEARERAEEQKRKAEAAESEAHRAEERARAEQREAEEAEHRERARSEQAPRPATPPTTVPPTTVPPATQPPTASEAPPTADSGSSATEGPEGEQTSAGSVAEVPGLTAGAASALMAAGVLAVIARRRRQASTSRRPGRRIPPIDGSGVGAVAALRQVAAPLTVSHLDRALRTLSARLAERGRDLPAISAIRLDDDRLDCRLLAPDHGPPAPFSATGDGRIWTLTVDRADQLLDAAAANQVAAPYPALVTLGQDVDGAHLLVDLETVAALTVTDPAPDGILAALAFELATSSWADDLTVSLVGTCPELPAALGVDRARYLESFDSLIDQLEVEAETHRASLTAEGLDSARAGRIDPAGADAWTPHVVLLGQPVAGDDAARLSRVLSSMPRVAVAAVTTGPDAITGWSLDRAAAVEKPDPETGDRSSDDGSVVLEPLGLRISPQRLSGEAYTAVCDALTQSQRTTTEPAPWWNHDAGAARPAEPELDPAATNPADDASSGDDGRPRPRITLAAVAQPAASSDDVGDTAHPAAAEQPQPQAETVSEDPESTASTTDLVALHRPTVMLLGEVKIINSTGTLAAGRSTAEVLEPIAYIYLRQPVATTDFNRDLAPRTDRPIELVSRARRYLGVAPDGQPFLPPAQRTADGRVYRLHEEVYSDWAHFHRYIDGGINTAPTTNLTKALRLVRGIPLESVAPGMWLWADDWREEAIATIIDTAHELADRSIGRGDIDQARWAVQKGRAIDPYTEILARDELRVERLAGNHARVARIRQRIITNAQQNQIELDPETVALLHSIDAGRRHREAT